MTDVAVETRAEGELGVGAPVLVLGAGFANSAAHQALAKRFWVFALGTGLSAEGVAEFATTAQLEGVGLIGVGIEARTALEAAAALGETAKSVVLVSPEGLLDNAPEVAVPKAVLIGTRDSAQPRDAVARYRKSLPRCSVVVIYDAGADIAADRPDAFSDAAGDFLDRQARFAFMTTSVAVLDD